MDEEGETRKTKPRDLGRRRKRTKARENEIEENIEYASDSTGSRERY